MQTSNEQCHTTTHHNNYSKNSIIGSSEGGICQDGRLRLILDINNRLDTHPDSITHQIEAVIADSILNLRNQQD